MTKKVEDIRPQWDLLERYNKNVLKLPFFQSKLQVKLDSSRNIKIRGRSQ